MKVTALKSFSGAVSMSRGETKDIEDMYIVDDLLRAGYVATEERNTQASADSAAVIEKSVQTGILDAEELQEMHFNELKKLAKDMGLDAKGSKEELIERLSSARVEVGGVE